MRTAAVAAMTTVTVMGAALAGCSSSTPGGGDQAGASPARTTGAAQRPAGTPAPSTATTQLPSAANITAWMNSAGDRRSGCALVTEGDLTAAIGGPALPVTSTNSHDGQSLFECVVSTGAGGLIVDLLDRADWEMYGNGSRLGDSPEADVDAAVSTAHGFRVITDLPGDYHLALRSEQSISKETDTAIAAGIVHNLTLAPGSAGGLTA